MQPSNLRGGGRRGGEARYIGGSWHMVAAASLKNRHAASEKLRPLDPAAASAPRRTNWGCRSRPSRAEAMAITCAPALALLCSVELGQGWPRNDSLWPSPPPRTPRAQPAGHSRTLRRGGPPTLRARKGACSVTPAHRASRGRCRAALVLCVWCSAASGGLGCTAAWLRRAALERRRFEAKATEGIAAEGGAVLGREMLGGEMLG